MDKLKQRFIFTFKVDSELKVEVASGRSLHIATEAIIKKYSNNEVVFLKPGRELYNPIIENEQS